MCVHTSKLSRRWVFARSYSAFPVSLSDFCMRTQLLLVHCSRFFFSTVVDMRLCTPTNKMFLYNQNDSAVGYTAKTPRMQWTGNDATVWVLCFRWKHYYRQRVQRAVVARLRVRVLACTSQNLMRRERYTSGFEISVQYIKKSTRHGFWI